MVHGCEVQFYESSKENDMEVCLFAGTVKNKNLPHKANMASVGLNTGNMLFWYALETILFVDRHTVPDCVYKKVDTTQYASFITTDLIWINEDTTFPTVRKQLEIAKDRPLIPISVGLQCRARKRDFNLHADTVSLLSEIQERCTIGVRGEYTADILSRYGIKNLQIIGCPSMYLPFDYDFKIRKSISDPERVSVNMRTLYSELTPKEIEFILYAADHNFEFCEQTSHPFLPKICKNPDIYEYLCTWLNTNRHLFFDVDDWREYMTYMDFSMGCRFHGNVIALWNHIPSLFITIDSRTEELCQHFSLPTMHLADFCKEQSIRHYYDLADYSEFNKNYANRLDEFITFLKRNHLPIRLRADAYYDKRIHELEQQLPQKSQTRNRL